MVGKKPAIVLSALFIGLGLCTCGGQQPQTNVFSEQKNDVPPETPKLKKRYKNAVCYKFAATPKLENQYSKEIEEMQQSMVAALNQKKIFNHVDTDISNVDIGNDTLLVIVQVRYFDIVGFWKRGFCTMGTIMGRTGGDPDGWRHKRTVVDRENSACKQSHGGILELGGYRPLISERYGKNSGGVHRGSASIGVWCH